ncbi:MAG: T9SS type A sorting domain-containing protein [Prevotellaceae bacterium]|jgi:hypothetical protein|nr:T9SS type A sorting domain-containing protein [Prevotellaceae bacterium]
MKCGKNLFLLMALMILPIGLSAQAIEYEYDASGNRVKRSISTRSMEIDTALLYQTVADSIDMDKMNDFDLIVHSDDENVEDKTLNVKVYPNPTSGILDVEVDNLQANQRARLEIYTFAGRQVKRIERLQNRQSLDISNQPAGIYLFRIVVDEKSATLKVIKQ